MKLREKLRSKSGLTMTELLVTLAILSLLLTAVIIGIGAAGKVRSDSTLVSRTQMLASTLRQAVSEELRFAREITVDGNGVLTYTSPNFGANAMLVADDEGHLAVQLMQKDASGTVTLPQKEPMALLGSGVYGAYTTTVSVSYLRSEECFQVDLAIYEAAQLLREQTYYVRALNPPA